MQIPLFPLSLLPLPGELVPLHIFEPRYRQLLTDTETLDTPFGIYCNHTLNEKGLGSLMKLESIIKRYPTGESDIILRCTEIFSLDKMLRNYQSKMYPGAEVTLCDEDSNQMPGVQLYQDFIEYQKKRHIRNHLTIFNIYQIASELNFDLFDRYKLLTSSFEGKLHFLSSRLRFQLHLMDRAEKSKDLYYLN
jgi:hypothetical protein